MMAAVATGKLLAPHVADRGKGQATDAGFQAPRD